LENMDTANRAPGDWENRAKRVWYLGGIIIAVGCALFLGGFCLGGPLGIFMFALLSALIGGPVLAVVYFASRWLARRGYLGGRPKLLT
jgi:hypothetical protein